jgi:hypothetical protein
MFVPMVSPEMNLILALTGDIYRQPEVHFPSKVNWEKFWRLASLNKVLSYVTTKIAANPSLITELKIPQSLIEREKPMRSKRAILGRSIEVADKVLGREPHLLLKTYRGYPFVSHDIDMLVQDLGRARKLFQENGFKPLMWWDKRSFEVIEKEFLEIEIYDKISPGPMNFIDETIAWTGTREIVVEGVKVSLPSVEADLMTFMADMSFRTYEITLGDLVYLFKISPEADWNLMAKQAKKHNWLAEFNYTVMLLNSFHRKLYREPSPMEEYLRVNTKVNLDLPYIFPLPYITRGLWKQGPKNLMKLPGYYSVILKRNRSRLHQAYCKLVLIWGGEIFGKHVYHD